MHRFSLFVFLLAISASLSAQFTIEGCVIDEENGEGLIGATILIKDSETGTVTDFDGCFSLDSPSDPVLVVISYTGYRSKEVELSAEAEHQIYLSAEGVSLEEVVVSGYGRESRRAKRERRRAERRSTSSDAVRAIESSDLPPPPPPAPGSHVIDGIAPTADVALPATSAATSEAYSASRDDDARAVDPTAYEDFEEEAAELPAAGQLTAGEINDFGKWDLWKDVSLEDLYTYRDDWGYYPEHRYGVQLRFPSGSPVIDAHLELRTSAGRTLWAARTDNMGRGELWRSIFDQQDIVAQERLEIYATYEGLEYRLESAKSIQEGYNNLTIYQECYQPREVDVAFVVDATGSMGDEIQYLSSELLDVMQRSIDSLSGQEVRLGSVFYRDEGDAYLTRHSVLSAELETTVNFVKAQSAGGGGDTPEAVDAGLEVALTQLGWNEQAAARLLFLVLDAAPHEESDHTQRMKELGEQAAKMGIRIIPVVCSGMYPSGEYLMRSLALATNGTYTFLTDHSGIGGAHLEPSTDSYEVEKLNDLLVRLIIQFGQTEKCAFPIVDSPSPTEIPELGEGVDWTVFPNPTVGPATVRLRESGGQLTILDPLGKALRQYELNSEIMDINLSGLASGTYLLRYLDSVGETRTEQIILEYTR
ncbi:MAG: carboxypeptidase-like regulatory domain-containing protein [Bacteroidota bacterium]